MIKLAETVAANLPSDVDMIEHNPDEGSRYFCCGRDVSFHVHPSRWPPGSESREGRVHAPDCWYMAIQAALVAHDAALTCKACKGSGRVLRLPETVNGGRGVRKDLIGTGKPISYYCRECGGSGRADPPPVA